MSCIRTAKRTDAKTRNRILHGFLWLAGAIGTAGAAYAIYAGVNWLRYGHAKNAPGKKPTSVLDSVMPAFEVAESHSIRVSAPYETAFAAASNLELFDSFPASTIFKLRELILGSTPDERRLPRGLLAQAKALGWGVLAKVPDRDIVMGAVTRPWEADVVFRSLPRDAFAAFHEPGYVKIAWTLAAEPISATETLLHTETRAATTDASSRSKFRLYWSAFSPGIILLRKALLRSAKHEAERSARNLSSGNLLAPQGRTLSAHPLIES